METGFRLWLLTLPRLLGVTHDLFTEQWPCIRDREKQQWPEKAVNHSCKHMAESPGESGRGLWAVPGDCSEGRNDQMCEER